CLTPPPPPAGPIPIPYPDTSFSKDMQEGTKTVMIKGQEVMMKDQSFYKTSPLGDEAATNGQGANVITHVITGKTYFVAWSMDVKFEGANVDRHTDLTTSNHACPPAGDPTPNPNAARGASAGEKKCDGGGGPAHAEGRAMTMEQWYEQNTPQRAEPPPAAYGERGVLAQPDPPKEGTRQQMRDLLRRASPEGRK